MKTALVTGISSGIGFHLSVELAREGWSVYGLVRNPQKLQDSLSRAGMELPERLTPLQADIDNPDETLAALRELPLPDLLINNAGYGLYGPFEELSEVQMKAQFETNFFSPLRLIRHFLPGMRERGSGRIINVSSILGQIVIPTASAYCASKWALEAASEAMRYELAPFGIEVCLIEPGLIRTDFKANMKLTATVESEHSPYAFFNRLILDQVKQYNRYTTSVESATDSVLRLLRRRRLPARHRIGVDAAMLSTVKKLLPASLVDLIQRSYTENLHAKD